MESKFLRAYPFIIIDDHIQYYETGLILEYFDIAYTIHHIETHLHIHTVLWAQHL